MGVLLAQGFSFFVVASFKAKNRCPHFCTMLEQGIADVSVGGRSTMFVFLPHFHNSRQILNPR
jgi:hypothetical protein